jgi:hypothetical protein
MNEHDQRQYRWMLQNLREFESGKISADTLIDNLHGLLNALLDVRPAWRQEFLDEWGVLEEARAVAIFRQQKVFSDAASQRIRAATTRLKALVGKQLANQTGRA